tara:strand:+ start:491 stop:1216 length:726 start_codon:yes stop_codon:yes gene_type:complete
MIFSIILNEMKSQFIKKNDSEKIYQEMTRDAFGAFGDNKSLKSKNLLESEYTKQFNSLNKSKYEVFIQKVLNTFNAELQGFLPGAFQITPQTAQCLSYANLHSWYPGRAYFSLFESKNNKSIWILHLSRSVGEGLAYSVRKAKCGTKINLYRELREADSLIFLEIGEILRKLFSSLIKLWYVNNLKFSRCQHILQLGFQKNVHLDEEYIILPFFLNNKDCEGDLHLIFPIKYLHNLVDAIK